MTGWRNRLHELIFEADTRSGKLFDVLLMASILASVAAVMADSVAAIHARHGQTLYRVEWAFTIFFTLEYFSRIACVRRPSRYIFSFFGLIDLLAILPTYLSLLIPGTQYMLAIRVLRVIRVFRVLKLVRFVGEEKLLRDALRASGHKILVFVICVCTLVVVLGSMMFLIEGPENGFTSIPISVYWAIVTLTTVGYGNIAPQTPPGQLLAAFIMICGYGIIAVPTGIVTVELANVSRRKFTTQVCPSCCAEGHDSDATHCKFCGAAL